MTTLDQRAATIADLIKTAIARVEIEPELAPIVAAHFLDEIPGFGADEAHTSALYVQIVTWLSKEHQQDFGTPDSKPVPAPISGELFHLKITDESTRQQTLIAAIGLNHGRIDCVCGNAVAACRCHWASKQIGTVEPCVCLIPASPQPVKRDGL